MGGVSADKHIVDVLIEERAERLMARPVVWDLVRRLFLPLVRHKTAMHMIDTIQDRDGVAVMDWVVDLLRLDLTVTGLERVPRSGPVVLCPNHPTGLADGIAIFQALRTVRPDVCFFANRDAIRVAERLADVIIPVEWVEEKRTRARSRETLYAAVGMFQAHRAVVLFPSGRLAQRKGTELVERPWQPTPITFARKFKAPIVPVHIHGTNSLLFYLLEVLNDELKNMTLFNEMLNKAGKPFSIDFGAPIAVGDLPADPGAAIDRLHRIVTVDLPAERRRGR